MSVVSIFEGLLGDYNEMRDQEQQNQDEGDDPKHLHPAWYPVVAPRWGLIMLSSPVSPSESR